MARSQSMDDDELLKEAVSKLKWMREMIRDVEGSLNEFGTVPQDIENQMREVFEEERELDKEVENWSDIAETPKDFFNEFYATQDSLKAVLDSALKWEGEQLREEAKAITEVTNYVDEREGNYSPQQDQLARELEKMDDIGDTGSGITGREKIDKKINLRVENFEKYIEKRLEHIQNFAKRIKTFSSVSEDISESFVKYFEEEGFTVKEIEVKGEKAVDVEGKAVGKYKEKYEELEKSAEDLEEVLSIMKELEKFVRGDIKLVENNKRNESEYSDEFHKELMQAADLMATPESTRLSMNKNVLGMAQEHIKEAKEINNPANTSGSGVGGLLDDLIQALDDLKEVDGFMEDIKQDIDEITRTNVNSLETIVDDELKETREELKTAFTDR